MACPAWCREPDCDLVYGNHPWNFGVSAAALPTRGKAVQAINDKEKRWDRDMPAFKTMRDQGLNPQRIDGCADLAMRASDELEISYGKTLSSKANLQTAKSLLGELNAA